ncbi:hypothetical protein D3C87_1589970 [compost metagenome]
MLYFHRYFRVEAMLTAVKMRLKRHAIIVDPGELISLSKRLLGHITTHVDYFFKADTKAHHLESTTICKRWLLPVHKAM